MKVNTFQSTCNKSLGPSVAKDEAREFHPLKKVRDGRSKKAATVRGIGIALLGAASALSAVPSAQAGSADPADCAQFMQKFFSSGMPSGSKANFTLVTENTSQAASYAEGGLALGGNIFVGTSLSGTGTQYLSTSRYPPSSCKGQQFCFSDLPFDPNSTAQVSVNVRRSNIGINGRNLFVTLRSPLTTGSGEEITPLGCLSDNVVYGYYTTFFGLTGKIVTIGVGALQPPQPPPK